MSVPSGIFGPSGTGLSAIPVKKPPASGATAAPPTNYAGIISSAFPDISSSSIPWNPTGSMTSARRALPAAPTPTAPLLSTPGAYENWLKANSPQLNGPSNVESLYSSGGTALPTSPLSTLGSQDNSGAYGAWLNASGGSPSAGNSAGVLAGAGTGPQAAMQLFNSGGPKVGYSAGIANAGVNSQNSQGLLASGQPAHGASSGVLSSPNYTLNSQNALAQGAPNVDASGRVLAAGAGNTLNSQAMYNSGAPNVAASGKVLDTLATGPSNSTNVYSLANGAMKGPGAYEQMYNTNGTAFNAPSTGEKFQSTFGGDPMQLSDTEKLYNSGVGQLDPYYDYAEKRAIQAAQTASSARGGFNSGLAAQQESDITGNLRGQQAQSWVNLAPQADAAKLARYGQGEQFAQDATNDYNTRVLNAFGLANTDQTQQQNRYSTLSGIASAGDAADLGRNALRVTSANNVDQNSIGAYNARESAAANADQSANTLFTTKGNIANNIDQNSIGAYNAFSTRANNADTQANQMFQTRGNIANNVDQNSIQAYQAFGNVAANADTAANNLYSNRVTASGNADTANVNAFNSLNTAASNADSAYNNNLSTRGNIASSADSAAINAFNAGSGAQNNLANIGLNQQTNNLATATAQDTSNRANAQFGINSAAAADAAKYGRLGTQGGMMQDLQSTGQNRIQGGLSATTSLSNSDASAIQSILSDNASIDQMDATQLDAVLARAGVSIEERNSIVDLVKSGGATATAALTSAGKK